MQPLKTYIVEDSQVIRDSLISMLEELVPVVVVGAAETEAGAVQWLSHQGNQADLLIVDIFLKTGSGLGVLRAAQKLEGRRTVVVLSNYATADIRRKCLELGALISYCDILARGDTTSAELAPLP